MTWLVAKRKGTKVVLFVRSWFLRNQKPQNDYMRKGEFFYLTFLLIHGNFMVTQNPNSIIFLIFFSPISNIGLTESFLATKIV